MALFEIFKAHEMLVRSNDYKPTGLPCKHCESKDVRWRFHGGVIRQIRYIAEKEERVFCFFGTVLRWMCSKCKRTFHHLPPFVEPYMRYCTQTIKDRAEKILNFKRKPYRDTVLQSPPNKNRILYDRGDGSALSHVSVWRWVQWMGCLMAVFLKEDPKMAESSSPDSFEFAPEQAITTETRENLYLARRLNLAMLLDVEKRHLNRNGDF